MDILAHCAGNHCRLLHCSAPFNYWGSPSPPPQAKLMEPPPQRKALPGLAVAPSINLEGGHPSERQGARGVPPQPLPGGASPQTKALLGLPSPPPAEPPVLAGRPRAPTSSFAGGNPLKEKPYWGLASPPPASFSVHPACPLLFPICAKAGVFPWSYKRDFIRLSGGRAMIWIILTKNQGERIDFADLLPAFRFTLHQPPASKGKMLTRSPFCNR